MAKFGSQLRANKWLVLGAAAALLVVGGAFAYHSANSKPKVVAVTPQSSSSPSPSASAAAQSSPSPSAAAKAAGPSTPKPTPQPTAAIPVTIVGLSAHVETGAGYELDAQIGSDYATAPTTCKLTMTKAGSTPITLTQAVTPDPTKANGYVSWCHIIHLLASKNGSTWDYSVDPGLWDVTVTLYNSSASGSASGTVNVVKL